MLLYTKAYWDQNRSGEIFFLVITTFKTRCYENIVVITSFKSCYYENKVVITSFQKSLLRVSEVVITRNKVVITSFKIRYNEF